MPALNKYYPETDSDTKNKLMGVWIHFRGRGREIGVKGEEK